MNTILTAIALTIALPAMAHAQATPVPAPESKQDCCEKMKAKGKECCCKHMAEKGHGERGEMHGGDKSAEHDAHQH